VYDPRSVELDQGRVKASLSLRSDPAEFGRLISFAEGFASRHALPGTECARLLIILEELFTNNLKHGHDFGHPPGRIEVALALDIGQLRLHIEFSDDGRPFDPLTSTLPNLDQPAATRPVSGFGLHIVRSLVDETRYSRDGDCNHLVLTRNIVGPGRDHER
jgi:anti-sigma regulatory factor (Ser/Thr protein kinase)